jgi:glutathionyl-hydroquinone reductase
MPAVHDTEETWKQADADGRFWRQSVQLRSMISKYGAIPPEKGRYILYCALIWP